MHKYYFVFKANFKDKMIFVSLYYLNCAFFLLENNKIEIAII